MRLACILTLLVVMAAPAAARQVEEIDPLVVLGQPLRITGVDIVFDPAFEEARTRLDDKAARKRATAGLPALAVDAYPTGQETADQYETLPFKQMAPLILRESVGKWGLQDGRAVRLRLSFEQMHTADLAMAWLAGSNDELAGTVTMLDAATGAALGTIRIDVVNTQSGLYAMALRGSGVREKLVDEFGLELCRYLSGRKHPPKQA